MTIMVVSSSSSSSPPKVPLLKRSSSVREISSQLHRRFLRSLSSPMATTVNNSSIEGSNLQSSHVNDSSNYTGSSNNNTNGNLGLGLNFTSTLNTSKSKSNRGRQLEPSLFQPSPLSSDKVISSSHSSPTSSLRRHRSRAKSNASICSTPTSPGSGLGFTCHHVTPISMSSPNINTPQTPTLTNRSSLSTSSVLTPKTASPAPSEGHGGYFECKFSSNAAENAMDTPMSSYQEDLPPPPTSSNNNNNNNENDDINNNNNNNGRPLTSINLAQIPNNKTAPASVQDDTSMPSLAKIASNDEDAAADEMAMHILAMVKSNDKSWIKSDVFEDGLLTL